MRAASILGIIAVAAHCMFAQAPVITSVSPTAGAAGINVTISGSGFTGTTQNTFVRFGTALASVSAVQQGTIIAQAPGNPTYGPVSVTTNGRTAYARSPFFVRYSSGGINASSYQQPVPLGTVSSNGQTTYLVDIDGDGKLDVVLPQTNGSSVRIARNAVTTAGTFTFDAQVDIPTTWLGARGMSAADVDGDGKLDLVVACTGSASPGRIAVLRNTSTSGSITTSSFSAAVLFRDTTDFLFIPNDATVGDFDVDGKPDIAAVGQITPGEQMFVFRNVSTQGSITASSFAHPVRFAAGSSARRVRVADIDGDGKVDAVVSTQVSGSVVASIYRNTTTGSTITFAAPINLTLPAGAVSEIALGDLNDDRRPELVCATVSAGPGTVTVFENNSTSGTITFGTGVPYALPGTGYQVEVGDVDGNGWPDIVVMGNSQVNIFRNAAFDGPITSQFFAPRVDLTNVNNPVSGSIALGDIDGDARPEVVNSGYGSVASQVVVLRNVISSGFSVTPLTTGTTSDLAGVSFISRNNGCIAGRGGVVRVTTNAGSTWTVSNTGVTNDINSIRLIGTRGFIVGTSGLICISTNNGGSWTPFTTGTSETFYGASFTSETAGWAVGSGGIICRYNGSTWVPQTTGTTITFRSVFAVGATGYAVGANGTICRYNGTNWVPQTTGVTIQFNDVAFANEQVGYAVGASGTICKTTNGGTNWVVLNTRLGSLNFRSVKLVNANILWATADGGTVAQSSDGGTSWTSSSIGTADLAGIDFVDGTGVIVGNGGAGYKFTTTLVSVREPSASSIPTLFSLEQNYPNPFNPTTIVKFQIPNSKGQLGFGAWNLKSVSLKVYDLLGREVATLVDGILEPGEHSAVWNAADFSSGVYFYRLTVENASQSRRMILMK